MQLTFDSIQELEQFVLFAGHLGKQFAAAERAFEASARTINETLDEIAAEDALAARDEPIDANELPEAPLATAANRRKRRTKAEIAEAALLAESGPITIVAQSDVVPEESELVEPALVLVREPDDIAERIQSRAAALLAVPEAVTGIAHLRACQDFIKRFGLPEYSKGFADEFALHSNVMVYEDADRARHLAVLEFLENQNSVTSAN